MRIICVQTVVPGYTFDWVGIYAKFKEVSQCAAPLLWPCMNFTAQKRINTEQVFNIVISSLTKIFTNKMYHFMLHLLLDWMRTGQPHSRPPQRDPPCNCCPKPCQQFLLRQRYGPQPSTKSVNFRGCILYNVSLFQWKIVDASKNCGAWTALQVQGVWFQFFYFAFINAYPLKDSLVDRGTNVSRFPPLYFEYLGNVRENNNSRKSGRNNTRLLPVLQTVIHCKDGLRATNH